MAGADGQHSNLKSWVAVSIIIAGFVVGGVALPLHAYWLLWVGVGIIVLGAIIARLVNIMDNTEDYGPVERRPTSQN